MPREQKLKEKRGKMVKWSKGNGQVWSLDDVFYSWQKAKRCKYIKKTFSFGKYVDSVKENGFHVA